MQRIASAPRTSTPRPKSEPDQRFSGQIPADGTPSRPWTTPRTDLLQRAIPKTHPQLASHPKLARLPKSAATVLVSVSLADATTCPSTPCQESRRIDLPRHGLGRTSVGRARRIRFQALRASPAAREVQDMCAGWQRLRLRRPSRTPNRRTVEESNPQIAPE